MWVLVRNDGAYVARPGAPGSYTRNIRDARKFSTKSEAELNRCPMNERVAHLLDEVGA